jgi:glycosyltransferase involved in cell wall biosynthesis
VLDHTADLGGAELALARLAAAVDPREVELYLLAFSPGPLVERVRRAGHAAEVRALSSGLSTMDRASAGRHRTAFSSAVRLVPFVVRLARRVRELDVDLVHTTSLKADLIGVPVAALSRRPLVWHVHDRIAPDYLPASMVRLLRTLARRAPAHVIANSAATAATLPGVRRLTVAHPGLAPEQLADTPRMPSTAQSPVVGVLGRISPTKAQLDFVRAAALAAADHPEARFRVVGAATFGADDYERRVREEVTSLGLTHRLEFTGFVDDPVRELDAMSVCVHTASVPEPFGQVVVEAMGRGVPVVAAAGGGVDEILTPDEEGQPLGWLVPPGDVTALARAIGEALDDPGEAGRRAHRAWERAGSRFTIDRTAGAITAVWRSVASGSLRRSGAAGHGRESEGR